MDNDNRQPIYVVIGATGGIGSELCQCRAENGVKLVLGARDEEKLENLAGELDAHPVSLKATKTAAVDRLFVEAIEEYGRVAGAASCVGSVVLFSSVAANQRKVRAV